MRGAPLAITSAASSTTAPSTQPPETEPRKFPSPSMTRWEPTGLGAEPQVSTTVAIATLRPASRHDSAAARTSSSRVSIASASFRPDRLRRRESDPGVRAVAKWLAAGMSAAAENSLLDAVDCAPGSGNDLDRAGDAERSVLIGRDGERAIAFGERGARARWRLARGYERGGDVRAVAIGLALGCAAATERRPRSDGHASEDDLGIDRQRSIFADSDRVDLRVGLAAVVATDMDRPGRAIQGGLQQRLGARRVRIDPRSFDIGLEDGRLRENASARMDAASAVELDRRRLAGRGFNRLLAHVCLLSAPHPRFARKWPRRGRSARLRRSLARQKSIFPVAK